MTDNPSGQSIQHTVRGFTFVRTPDGIRIQSGSSSNELELSESQWQQTLEKLGYQVSQVSSYQEMTQKQRA